MDSVKITNVFDLCILLVMCYVYQTHLLVHIWPCYVKTAHEKQPRPMDREDCKLVLAGAVACSRTHGCVEETQLSSGRTLIRSELSSPNFNSSIRAERPFAIRCLNVK